jgi:D-3-phosphoglycerate dehydrogenase / 2-oxoglutarate reductase
MKAFVTANMSAEGLERLRKRMEVVYEPWGETRKLYMAEELAEKLKELSADVVIIETDLCHEEVFEAIDLKMIGVCRGEPLNVDVELATSKGIPVFNTPGRNADAVADMTLGFMLCLARKIVPTNNLLQSGKYDPEDPEDYMRLMQQFTGDELGALHIGIVGFGAIGRKVAMRLKGFGSKILVYDPFVKPEVFTELGVKQVELDELFRKSDMVTIHAAINDETEGMIKGEYLKLMKPTAFFLNLARAELVDNDTLLDLLKNHKIAGGAFDVFMEEPPKKEDPFMNLDNAIVMPHMGGASHQIKDHQSMMILNDFEAYLDGRRPIHICNPEVLRKKK